MKHNHPITVNNRKFETLSAAALHYGVARTTALSRLDKGKTPEQAFGVSISQEQFSPHEIEFGQNKFSSIADFARHYDLNPNKVRARIYRGQSVGEILNKMLDHPISEEIWVLRGTTYTSLAAVGSAFNIKLSTLNKRLHAGWSLTQAVGLTARPSALQITDNTKDTLGHLGIKETVHDDSLLIEGKHYTSERAAALSYGVALSTFYQRRKKGLSLSDALGIQQKTKSAPKTIECAGKQYPSVRALAKAYNISPHSLRYRLNTLSLSPEKAVAQDASAKKNVSVSHNAQPICYKGKDYPSVRAFANAFNVPPRKVHRRIASGWTLVQSINDDPRASESTATEKNKKPTPKEIVLGDQVYPSIRAFAKAYELSPHSVRYRLMKGDSPETIAGVIEHVKNESVSTQFSKVSDMAPFTVQGHTFKTAVALATHFGLNAARVTGRLRNGWTPEESVELVPHRLVDNEHTGQRTLRLGGKHFHNARELADHYQQSPRVVQYRLSQGATAAQAVGIRAWSGTPHKGHEVIYNKVKYPSYRALCETLSLDYNKFMGRINRKWSLDEAVNGRHEQASVSTKSQSSTPKVKTRTAAVIKNKTLSRQKKKKTASEDPLTHQHGIDALLPDLKQSLKLGKKTFTSVLEFAQHLKLDVVVVSHRLQMGWSPEQVAGKEPPPHWH